MKPLTHEEIEAAVGHPIVPGLHERVIADCERSGVPVDIDPNDPRMRDMAVLAERTEARPERRAS